MASAADVLDQTPSAARSELAVSMHSGDARDRESSATVSPAPKTERGSRNWPAMEWLPVQISIALPLPRFRVRDLLTLDPGQIVSTEWPNGDDLPLSVDQVQLAWVEMESVEQEMAVRITRLL